MARLAIARLISAPEEWDRRKLQILLILAVLVTVTVVAGGFWSVAAMLHGSTSAGADQPRVGTRAPAEGGAINVQLPPASLEDAQPGTLTTGSTGTITIPQPNGLGPAQVQTGFPHTPEGALAQLVAIDRRAIESASVVTAQDVITGWAASGGPTPQTWSGVQGVASLLTSAGLPADGSTDLVIELRPAMGLVREASGDEAVTCVDFVLTMTAGEAPASRIAVADCQRMVRVGGRWMIGPGDEPDPSPSLWPGTEASYDAGYQWLEVSP